MNIFSNLVRKAKRPSAERLREMANAPDRKERSFIERTLGVKLYKFTDYESYLQAGSSNVWATFRACDLTANVVLGATFKFTTKGKDGTATEVDNPALTPFLTTPNMFDSWEELLYMWTFHMKLTGNAYWLKDEVNKLGQPLALYPLLPQYMQVTPDRKTKIAKYTYQINGQTLDFAPEEIIHFRRPHPSDLIFGIGDVEPSEAIFEEYINRKELENKFIENGATPSGVMSREVKDNEDEMDETTWGKLKKKWEEEYGGTKNAGKTMFLSGKWTFSKLGLTHQEMQSLDKERYSVETIFMNHGVPLSIAGVKEAANYATARQDDINFRKYTVVPLINLLVGKLNQKGQFVQNFGEQLRLSFDLTGLIDVEQAWKDYGQMLLNGCITRNEMRALVGMEKVDDPLMDAHYVPQGIVPIEMAGMSPEPAEEEIPEGEEDDEDEEDIIPPARRNGDKPPRRPASRE